MKGKIYRIAKSKSANGTLQRFSETWTKVCSVPKYEAQPTRFSVCLQEADDGAIDLVGIKCQVLAHSADILIHPNS